MVERRKRHLREVSTKKRAHLEVSALDEERALLAVDFHFHVVVEDVSSVAV